MSIDTDGGPGTSRTLWIGSYTGDMGQGDGVSILPAGGSRPQPLDLTAPSPSWLVDTGSGVIAVSEADPGLVTWVGDGATPASAAVPTGSGWPCHAAVVSHDLGAALLAVAHYGSGRLTLLALEGGRPGEVVSTIDLGGLPLGPQRDRQDGSHPHQVVLDDADPAGPVLLVPDLGADVVHRISMRDASLGQRLEPVDMPAGFGPRHLVVVDDILLVVGELSSKVWVGRRDGSPAGWGVITTRSTLLAPLRPGESSDPDVGNLPSAIRLAGNVVAIGNRGADRVTLFELDPAAGSLRPLAEVPSHGGWPRDLLIDGDDLWVACERAHRVTRVRWRGPEPGALIRSYEAGSPTSLLLR